MTRLRKRGTRQKERPSLADFIKARCLEALRTTMADVMADGGDIEAKIAERVVEGVLRDPEVLARIKGVKGQEDLLGLAREMPEIIRELEAEQAKPPTLLIPQRPDKINIEPPALHAMLTEATATVTSAADDALAESADTDAPPTQNELAAWFGAGYCPPETLAAVAERLAVLWDTEPGKVSVTGWAFGGLVTWLDGDMFHTPVAELLATAKRKNVPNPLAPLVNAWLDRESATYTSRHVQVVQTATGRYTKTPGCWPPHPANWRSSRWTGNPSQDASRACRRTASLEPTAQHSRRKGSSSPGLPPLTGYLQATCCWSA